MARYWLVVTTCCCCWTVVMMVTSCGDPISPSSTPVLSRHKRFVTFPEGSALTFLVCCNSVAPFAMDIFTFGIDLDMSWDLPNNSRVFYEETGEQQRRDRRDLYIKLEDLFSAAGLDGRTCLLKALCEVTRELGSMRGDGGIVEELLRIVFTIPPSKSGDHQHAHYDAANLLGRHDHRECRHIFPGCPISLLDLFMS